MINQLLKPMLLHKSFEVPHGEYLHQLKHDGHRCILSFDESKGMRLFTRHGNECTYKYPEMRNVRFDRAKNVILDGEMIVLDKDEKPCFESVMKRFLSTNESTIRRNAELLPVHFVVFDILFLNGKPTIDMPIEERLALLPKVIISSSEISVCKTFEVERGKDLLQAVSNMGLEGIVCKKKGSKYKLDTRSHDWLKVKNYQYEVVEITGIRKETFGWTLSKNGRCIGVMEFVPPFARKALVAVAKKIKIGENKSWIYLQPLIRCEVQFQCFGKSGLLRSPSFVKFVGEKDVKIQSIGSKAPGGIS